MSSKGVKAISISSCVNSSCLSGLKSSSGIMGNGLYRVQLDKESELVFLILDFDLLIFSNRSQKNCRFVMESELLGLDCTISFEFFYFAIELLNPTHVVTPIKADVFAFFNLRHYKMLELLMENLQDVEKRIREEVQQEMQKEMQDMKRQILEQLLVSYGMPIPSPPSQTLDRSVGLHIFESSPLSLYLRSRLEHHAQQWWQRLTSNRAFSLRRFIETVVDTELSQRLIPILSSASIVLDFQDILQRFTFDNICRIAFRFDPQYLLPSLPETKFARAFEEGTKLSSERSNAAIPLYWKIKKLLNIGSEKRFRMAI
ncbi:cytochrome P450 94A2-like [Senna tora]|uniref:Cytochrome P450 94A2-like n=1 Tax=Senna tora TaxID=362788 RepID=A0A834SZC4_9FABA|nr:cytochrome P450 94A2-like [Senna tora]